MIIAVVIVLAVLLGDHLSGLALAPFGIVLVGQVFQIGYHCYIWGARSAVQIPLVVSAQGLSFNTARGPVRLPWPAIESMSLRSRFFGRVLVIRPQPGVRVDSPGVEICYPARTWARAVRSGLMLGSRGIHETLDQVAAAITSASDGRLRLR